MGKINTVAISPNGEYALTGGNDHHAFLWSTKTGRILLNLSHQQRVVRVALQRDGKYAFTADGGNEARIWDLKTGKVLSHLHSFSRQLIFTSARFSDDGLQLVTGSPTGRVAVWETRTGDKLGEFDTRVSKETRPPRAVVYDAAFDQSGHIISANSAGYAESWSYQ